MFFIRALLGRAFVLGNYNYSTESLMSNRGHNSIVWVDLEMTGLNHMKDQIMEISCLITDKNLNITAEGPDIVIHQPDSILNSMDEWCTTHHAETGLTEASRNSNISLEEAECEVLGFLQKHIPQKTCPLAGNSIYMDRLFLKQYMPRVDEYLHYRIIDVSTIKELCKRWNPSIFHKAPNKKLKHRSMDDIKESIQELQYYRNFMFR